MHTFKLVATALASTALLAAPTVSADANAESVEAKTKGQIKLEKMLKGRVSGDPQSCIPIRPTTDVTIIDGTAIVYRSGGTLYVNTTADPERIDDDDTLVRRTSMGHRLCKTDIITTIDRHNGFFTGSVNLVDFVPYRKAE